MELLLKLIRSRVIKIAWFNSSKILFTGRCNDVFLDGEEPDEEAQFAEEVVEEKKEVWA